MAKQQDPEHQPLLQEQGNGNIHDHDHHHHQDEPELVEFSENDPENPRDWPLTAKYFQTFQIFVLAAICPMSSSINAPAMNQIAAEFNCSSKTVLAAQTGFVCMLGIGPLFLAPMSETFGRRFLFVTNLAIFTLLQIPVALAPNVVTFVVLRTISGFFGSVGVANGGGSISDLFEKRGRAPVLGVYLTAPLFGPTLGPFVGGLIVGRLDWRWIFWILMVLTGSITLMCYFFLHETQGITILQKRKLQLEQKNKGKKYKVEGFSDQSITARIRTNSTKALRILLGQPIVLIMSTYGALIFSSMYSLYSQYVTIWSTPPYNFTTIQVGFAYLGPMIGFIIAAFFMVYFIDRVYEYCCNREDNEKGSPEYRLPLANVGALLLPASMFWFGWTIEEGQPWPVPLAATILFGASQASIFNSMQTYFIDAYEGSAASALAASAFLRSIVGGVVPLFISEMYDSIGYGWGMSIFGFLGLILMPAPLVFYRYGAALREKYPFKP